ncbi:RDD family protein [Christiangramia salexigens]|uniref:RDD family protein n=1 Tax=Christiangramia salexigens TaxID=1913577 RepID=UPI003C2F0DEE
MVIVFVILLNFIPASILENPLVSLLIISGIFLVYYNMMEVVFQKTLGKFITRTRVVTANGRKPKEKDIILRTFCRFIPFDNFSYIGGGNGFHDQFSKTKVIKDKRNRSF